jgi:hypothetical protein
MQKLHSYILRIYVNDEGHSSVIYNSKNLGRKKPPKCPPMRDWIS